MNNELPLVSIICVNYNSLKDTIDFLESIQHLTYKNVEIFVVDNASRENPGNIIMEKFPTTKFIRSDINLGFAGGNNLAVKQAVGKYIFFLNNDTVVYPNFLENIVEFMEAHPDAGMATPKIVYPDEITLQYTGAIGINFLGRGKRLGVFEKDTGQYDTTYKTDLGHGAALMVPKKVIDEVGMMPEEYFLYYEEHDWCEMVKRHGYAIYYIGTSKIIHKGSVSTGGNESYIKVHYLNRNRLLFMRRNFTLINFILGTVYFLFFSIPLNVIRFSLKRRFDLIKALYDGIVWNLKNPAFK